MILAICASQVDEYAFTVSNTVSQQQYDNAEVDLSTVTEAVLYFKKVNDVDANRISVNIGSGEDESESTTTTTAEEGVVINDFGYLFEDGGMTVHFEDFGEDTYNGYDYFPDWMYEITIKYTYDGIEYAATTTVGFKAIINRIVYQQMLQANWKKELACYCNCNNQNSTLRKYNFLMMMEAAMEQCLVNEYLTILKSLYKTTGTIHEFSQP
jgi:hypothetical protein